MHDANRQGSCWSPRDLDRVQEQTLLGKNEGGVDIDPEWKKLSARSGDGVTLACSGVNHRDGAGWDDPVFEPEERGEVALSDMLWSSAHSLLLL